MNKSNYTLSVLSVFILAGFLSCSETRRPNIVLFLVDDMGWQDTSVPFHSERTPFNDLYQTPSMERLAAQGMKFTQAYSHSVCSPTRVSLMSGMNAARHRVTNWTLRRNATNDRPHETLNMPGWNVNGMQPTDSIEHAVYVTPLPQILKDNGYFTIHCGKAHFGAISTPGEDPSNLGFNINIAGHAAGGPGSFHGEKNYSAVWRNGSPVWDVPGLDKYHGTNTNLTEALTREAILALDSAMKTEQPFFLYMSHYAVHAPIEEDYRFIDKYQGMNPVEAKYASMLESMDKSLGDLMDYLKKKGIDENTIVLFTSDNGGLSAVARGGVPHTHNKPLSSGKGSAHEGGIREPMIVSWPGVTRGGSTTDSYLIIEDFFPTILEMAQINNYQTVQQIDGKSFGSILKRENDHPNERALFWHIPNNWGPTGPGIGASSTIRKGDWKLIYYHASQNFELFNISDDIAERNNLAPREKETRDKLAKELGEYLRSVDAQMPTFKATGGQVPWPDEILR
ncbi:MAG: sulfatase [Cytophagales bacterium]|nr:sulfatase [Cytophagales bacterium]